MDISELLPNINISLPNIVNLEINEYFEGRGLRKFVKSFEKISKLKNLEKLTLNFNGQDPSELFNYCQTNAMKLRELVIIKPNLTNEALMNLGKLSQLKKLTISCYLSYDLRWSELKNSIAQLYQLKSLTLHGIVQSRAVFRRIRMRFSQHYCVSH